VGECANDGVEVCTAAGDGTECNAVPGTPSPELCDGLDNDCNGAVDEGTDADGDGYFTAGDFCGQVDCNDADPAVNPGATEQCNGIDDNCDGVIDDVDSDGDGISECAGADFCLGSVLPEGVPTEELKPNHYANTDTDTIFEEGPLHIDSEYTLADTGGCTCAQIIDGLPGKKNGLQKFGCTKGIMDKWIDTITTAEESHASEAESHEDVEGKWNQYHGENYNQDWDHEYGDSHEDVE
jgi:hypothetical protein